MMCFPLLPAIPRRRSPLAQLTQVASLLCALCWAAAALADEATYHGPPGRADTAPFSEAVVYDDLIFLSGNLGIVPETRTLAEGGVGPETRQALTNMQAALERAGGSMDRVLKCTVFLADIADWGAMNEVYVTFFENKPARSAVGDIGLAIGAKVEIECLAAAPDDEGEEEEEEEEENTDGEAMASDPALTPDAN